MSGLVDGIRRPTLAAPDTTTFNHDEILVLASAYDKALSALTGAGLDSAFRPGATAAARHRLAQEIVRMGRAGERDPERLHLGAVPDLRRTGS
jgi:hypothetical protein